MRQIPGRKLWIGNAGDLRDPRALFDVGIQAVVELWSCGVVELGCG
jgi:hypothetical protein